MTRPKYVVEIQPPNPPPVVISIEQDLGEVDLFMTVGDNKQLIMTFKADGFVDLYSISDTNAKEFGVQRMAKNFIKCE